MSNFSLEGSIFFLICVSLFCFAITNFLTGAFAFLFVQSDQGASLFALICLWLFLGYFLIWGIFQIESQFKGEKLGTKIARRILFSKTANFIGLKKPSLKGSLYIILSMIVGIVFNFLVLLVLFRLSGATLYWVSSPSLYMLVQNLVIPPIFEELIFRGIYLSVFLKLFGKTYASAGFGLVLSSFTFGWIHPVQPLIKTIAGLLLGLVYMWGWKKNIVASSLTHFGANLVGTFLILVSH